MRILLVSYCCFVVSGVNPTLLASQTSVTVVSLFSRDAALHASHGDVIDTVSIRGQPFTCSLTHDAAAEKAKLANHRFRAVMSPLTGECVTSANVTVCPNSKLEFSTSNGQKEILSVTDKPALMAGHQTYVNGTGHAAAVLTCTHRPLPPPPPGKRRICRNGDRVPAFDHSVIVNTFSNGTALIMSTRKPDEVKRLVHMAAIGCGSDGTLDVTSNLLTVDSVTVINGLSNVKVSSPMCGLEDRIPTAESLISPMSGGCFTGSFLHRKIEYCHGDGLFRLVQDRLRLSHPWPTAIPIESTSRSEWTYSSSDRTIESTFSTSHSCAEVQPFLTDQFVVSVAHPKLTIHGVGGSFLPMSFPFGTNRVEGVLVFDSAHPLGCTDEAFPIVPNENWIAVVERNACMFHAKALIAQRKGAVGVIIVNVAKRGMIPAMAGVADQPVLDIPAVLVDTDGKILRTLSGTRAVIKAAPIPGQSPPSLRDALNFKVVMECDSRWDTGSFGQSCRVGDKVTVRREGESDEVGREIVEKLNADTFRVSLAGADSDAVSDVIQGWELSRDSTTPCTAQLGTFITSVDRTDTCEITVTMHSGFLCADKRFREPLRRSKDIVCEPPA